MYNDHPWESKIVAVVDKWSLFRPYAMICIIHFLLQFLKQIFYEMLNLKMRAKKPKWFANLIYGRMEIALKKFVVVHKSEKIWSFWIEPIYKE